MPRHVRGQWAPERRRPRVVRASQAEQAEGRRTRQARHEARVVGDRVQTDESALREQRLEEGCLDTPGGTY